MIERTNGFTGMQYPNDGGSAMPRYRRELNNALFWIPTGHKCTV